MCLSVQFGVMKTRELREMLQDEDKINHIVKCSEKFQGLQRSIERMLVRNQKRARVSLLQRPEFRDTKLILAMKYEELDRLRNIIRAKQEQLAGKYSFHHAQRCLLRKKDHVEEECELLFQRFAEGTLPLADFLDSFLISQKMRHIRLVLVRELQDGLELQRRSTQRLSDSRYDVPQLSGLYHEQVYNPCLSACGLTAAVVLPICCHSLRTLPVQPPSLLPFGTNGNMFQRHQHTSLYGHVQRQPTRSACLPPLKVLHRKHRQAPQ